LVPINADADRSESVLPRPKDWSSNVSVTGFLSLEDASQYSPPEDLRKFLASGPPPVFVGFGSIVVADPEAFLSVVVEAVRSTASRLILATGWSGGQGAGLDLRSYPEVFVLTTECPHDWLFPQVSCVVHHGGAGTTAAGLKAGRPTVIVPFFGDQHFWGDCVCEAGAGPPPIPCKQVTTRDLSAAVHFAFRQDVTNRTNEIGMLIRSEHSVEKAVASFNNALPGKGLACDLFPERAAVWKLRKTNLILSAVAAAVLSRRQLLNIEDLELHQKCDLDITHGPYEPASGAAWAITELLFDSFRGMGEILAEVGNWPVFTYRAGGRIKRRLPSDKPRTKGADAARAPAQQIGHPPQSGSKKALKFPGTYFVDGSLRIGKAAVRAPGEFTLAMAYGAHDLPRLWGDKTVRTAPRVTGVGSGLVAGCEELFWGVADGISGVFVQPVMGLVKEGPIGLAKGAARGVLGLPVKFFAGMLVILASITCRLTRLQLQMESSDIL
jgi:hypothetical protein